ncbi:hypothetical protein BDF20DRAFT_883943 [Mycotypha africana]|uniref:uncharacterized protein n=1 Tax=Mycotypha africana TaxID=64632 RepID=UPI0023008EC3|nr:uncharacterized protein BDF20DRAFT_883943 [Mycotypha africana]KAI8973764.1 hypothetical protein BDF20DRAFT_883943 [Mycotypha africana]
MNDDAMTPIVALAYFLCNQRKSLFGLEESEDPELINIYRIAAGTFEPYITKEEEKLNDRMTVMKNIKQQFQKISKCAVDDTILKKIKRYADDGFEYINKKIIMVEENEAGSITPIEKVMTADSYFVMKQREKTRGKFSWEACFLEGRGQNLFDRYRSSLSLKDAYHKNTL